MQRGAASGSLHRMVRPNWETTIIESKYASNLTSDSNHSWRRITGWNKQYFGDDPSVTAASGYLGEREVVVVHAVDGLRRTRHLQFLCAISE